MSMVAKSCLRGLESAETRPRRAENIFVAEFARVNRAGWIIRTFRCSPLPQGDETVKYSINLKGNAGERESEGKGKQFCGNNKHCV